MHIRPLPVRKFFHHGGTRRPCRLLSGRGQDQPVGERGGRICWRRSADAAAAVVVRRRGGSAGVLPYVRVSAPPLACDADSPLLPPRGSTAARSRRGRRRRRRWSRDPPTRRTRCPPFSYDDNDRSLRTRRLGGGGVRGD